MREPVRQHDLEPQHLGFHHAIAHGKAPSGIRRDQIADLSAAFSAQVGKREAEAVQAL